MVKAFLLYQLQRFCGREESTSGYRGRHDVAARRRGDAVRPTGYVLASGERNVRVIDGF